MSQADATKLLDYEPTELRLTELRRFAYGELSPERASQLETLLANDPVAQARVDAMIAERNAFAERENVGAVSARIVEAADAPVASKRGWLWALVGTAVAGAAAAMFVVGPLNTGSDPAASTTRTKGGGPGLELYVKDATGVRRAKPGIRLTEGDQIQLKYAASGLPHLMVVSVDARGLVSPLYPDGPGESLKVDPSGLHVLDGSIILDDAKGPEHIIGLFSAEPLTYDEVRQAAQDALRARREAAHLPELALPRKDVVETRVMIIKE